jgi:hypothetical protein
MCEDFISAALCRHSLLMAMHSGYDVTPKFPAKYSTKKLELRAKLTRTALPSVEDEGSSEDD